MAAVGLLPVNALVCKTMWPGSWFTGKLGDFARVVFAPPLLAYLLLFVNGRNPTGQRVAFVAAYVGTCPMGVVKTRRFFKKAGSATGNGAGSGGGGGEHCEQRDAAESD